jgi:hypothetical protein
MPRQAWSMRMDRNRGLRGVRNLLQMQPGVGRGIELVEDFGDAVVDGLLQPAQVFEEPFVDGEWHYVLPGNLRVALRCVLFGVAQPVEFSYVPSETEFRLFI